MRRWTGSRLVVYVAMACMMQLLDSDSESELLLFLCPVRVCLILALPGALAFSVDIIILL